MTTINLYQNSQENLKKASLWSNNKGFFFSIGILAVIFIALFGLKATVAMLEKRSASLKEKIEIENKNITSVNNFDLISDIIRRLGLIKENLKVNKGEVTRIKMIDILEKLEKSLLPNVLVSSYEYKENIVSVTFISNNFSDVAKQILSFKSSNYFVPVNVKSVGRKDDGVECVVEMGI